VKSPGRLTQDPLAFRPIIADGLALSDYEDIVMQCIALVKKILLFTRKILAPFKRHSSPPA